MSKVIFDKSQITRKFSACDSALAGFVRWLAFSGLFRMLLDDVTLAIS